MIKINLSLKKMFKQNSVTTIIRNPKSTPITADYEISNTVLGLGINGKVVQCTNKKNNQKYALKVSHFL